MKVERLVEMANDIGDYFAAFPDPERAIEGIADHIVRFWDPRMRRQIVAHVEQGEGEGLSRQAAEAIRRLAAREGAA